MKHQRIAILAVMLAAFGIAALAVESGAQSSTDRKARVAVLDFDYGTVMSSSSSIFGTNVDIGKGITQLLVTDLVKNGTFSVIERSALDKVLAEQSFSNSNRADPASAARIGKILGVDYIIVGSITEFGNETNKQNVGGSGGNFHGFGIGGVGHSNSKANVAIDARVINIDTAEILAAAEGKGESSRSGVSLLGGGGNWNGFGSGNVDFGSSNFQNTIIGEATKKAVDNLAGDLAANSGRLSANVHTFKGEGLIAAIDGGQIVLNVGGKAGIKAGDTIEVTRVTREIKDPATGQVLRRLTTSVGTLRATDVDDVSAICTPVTGSGFQEGDHVTFTTDHAVNAVPAGSSPAASQNSQAQGSSSTTPGSASNSQASPSTPPAAGQSASGGDQPNFTAIKAEFVPGEKTIFSDDFSDMVGDEPPPHWKIRGATPELRVAGDTRELALVGNMFDIYPNLTGLPKNFTMEMDLRCTKGNANGASVCGEINWYFHDKTGKTELLKLWVAMDRATEDKKSTEWRLGLWDAKERLGVKDLVTDWNQPVKLAMWVQNGRIRFYVNGDRVFDFNQVEIGDIASLQIDFWTRDGTISIRRARFAESAPDFGQTIMASGKFVTHGILFDTDSDRVKPESAAVLQMIARVLTTTPDLNVEIDGHTDATGNAAHNMDLSKRRAEAVKNILVSQFGIDAGRLTTAGFGATKPIDNNNTPDGKANNRRVEFVRKSAPSN
jgi:outer membrane protein OmpA-like peptidoglycan-associated protein/curli biogenesis system outer membrane secretion channel CsgG